MPKHDLNQATVDAPHVVSLRYAADLLNLDFTDLLYRAQCGGLPGAYFDGYYWLCSVNDVVQWSAQMRAVRS